MTITTDQVQTLSEGRGAVFSGSEKIGAIGQVYLDDQSGAPSWVTVKTGLFGTSESFVPLDGADLSGEDITVRFSKDQVKNAPRVESDGQISPQEEDELYRYYGLDGAGTTTHDTSVDDTTATTADTAPRTTSADTTTADTTSADTTTADTTTGHDTSGPTTDDAMTRSEERAEVGTQTREAGRARLRKYVTTESVSQTVPVRHEEVTLEREPITDANVGAAEAGPAISEEEHEVVLHEEVPVVRMETVAVERVKLGTETVTEDTTVETDVRKEHVELVDPATPDTEHNQH